MESECGLNSEECEGDATLEDEIITLLEMIYYPNRADPLLFLSPNGELLVIMPVDDDPMADRPPLLEDIGDYATRIGIGLDWSELVFVTTPGAPSLGGLDFAITTIGSFASGESLLFEQPDPSLPTMLAFGQDTLWTGGVDGLLPLAGGAVGAVIGPEGALVGEMVIDACTTTASLLYDNWRYYGGGDSSWKAGLMFGPSIIPVVLFYPGKPN